MNTKLFKSLGIFFIAFGFISCDIETSLDENLEFHQVRKLELNQQLQKFSKIGIRQPIAMMGQEWYLTMADNQTCSWGNSGMRDKWN